jgi:hypothetical protein
MFRMYDEYIQDIKDGISPPDYIPSGGEHSCRVCGGTVTWPPTGEPCEGVCDDNCDLRIRKIWDNHLDGN